MWESHPVQDSAFDSEISMLVFFLTFETLYDIAEV